MSTITVTHRQWQNKSVALIVDADNRDRKAWEFHCGDCDDTQIRDTEQETLDLVVAHTCS